MVKICVPVCVRRIEDMREAVERAAAFADIIELRIDCLEQSERANAWAEIHQLAEATTQPFIVTMRPQHEGGNANISFDERLQFWSSARKIPQNVLIDLELNILNRVVSHSGMFEAGRIICSRHDFESVPENASDWRRRFEDRVFCE